MGRLGPQQQTAARHAVRHHQRRRLRHDERSRRTGSIANLVSLALDRGFLDGALLWWLHTTGITFYMPVKSNLDVYRDALSLTDAGVRQTREKTRAVGRGKDRKTVAGIEGLTSAGFYGERGSGSHEHNRDFVPNPINAVVVLYDPYRENNPNAKTLVILTNGPVQKPLVVYDAYDARSEIENSLFREAKQAWFIERPAKNTTKAFRAHCYLTLITMALTTAFLAWMIATEKREHRGEETGIRIFRQEVRVENCNKLIVFDQDRYAIFEEYELVILLGKKVRMPRGRGSRDDYQRRHPAQIWRAPGVDTPVVRSLHFLRPALAARCSVR
ncbi:MAG: transposase [Proteobacteria bacterium]|nr:transposase [Pseudomonadota bacterium]